jgi:hypothetical protein
MYRKELSFASVHVVEAADGHILLRSYPCLWRARLAETGFIDELGPVSVESSPVDPLVLVSRSLLGTFLM